MAAITKGPQGDQRDAKISSAATNRSRSSWADGLRGIASIGVVASHTVLSFSCYMVRPADSEDGSKIELMQLPFLRLLAQGNSWVAVFFILLGYVNCLKCVTQSRAGQVDAALETLASSSFRRTGRLVLPAALVTCITWLACQLGLFELSGSLDSYWLRTTSPNPSQTWTTAIVDLGRELVNTWFFMSNQYDQPQWCLSYLLKGSVFVYIVLLATVRTTPTFRLMAEFVLYAWSWVVGDFLVGTNIFAGMMLAELTFYQHQPAPFQWLAAVPYAGAISGLFLMSFPNEYVDWAPWSRMLQQVGLLIFPPSSELGRAIPGLGAQILCFSVCFSPRLRHICSQKAFLWLGSMSYSLYLLHGPLMRSILAWLVVVPVRFGSASVSQPASGDNYIPLPKPLAFVVILPVFWAVLLVLVHLWNTKVEPKIGAATRCVEELALGNMLGPGEKGLEAGLPLHRSQAN